MPLSGLAEIIEHMGTSFTSRVGLHLAVELLYLPS